MRDTSESPVTLEERYAAARNTSDLTLSTKEHDRNQAEILVAASWAHSDLSSALSDLRSQWDRSPKVQKPTEAQLLILAKSYPKKGKPDHARARVEGLVWYTRQVRGQMAGLHAMGQVIGLVTPWCVVHGLDPALIRVAVYHFLDDACPVCDGQGNEKAKDAPSLTGKECLHCNGSGRWPEPREAVKIKNHLRAAVAEANSGMRRRMG